MHVTAGNNLFFLDKLTRASENDDIFNGLAGILDLTNNVFEYESLF